jgi:hypothetical protein
MIKESLCLGTGIMIAVFQVAGNSPSFMIRSAILIKHGARTRDQFLITEAAIASLPMAFLFGSLLIYFSRSFIFDVLTGKSGSS